MKILHTIFIVGLGASIGLAVESYPKADLNGDGKPEIITSEKKGRIYILKIKDGRNRNREWTMKFGLPDKSKDVQSQSTFCGEDIDITTEAGAKSSTVLVLSDGMCDAFRVYWNLKENKFDWERQ